MRGLNRVQIMGNLGADPEMRYTPAGRAVTRFRVAVSRQWRDSEGQQQKKVEWFRVVLWGRQAEVANQYLQKGDPLYIEGRLEHRSFEGNDGETRYITELVGREFIMLPRGDGNRSAEGIEYVDGAEEEELFEVAV
jgi:single-strand DNA-binding protein